MSDAQPYPKAIQLAGHRRKRYRRAVASRKQWEALRAEKGDACRICRQSNPAVLHLHHLVTRQDGGGDVADNLVPLCNDCHNGVHMREPAHCRLLLTRLSDAEYAELVAVGGEDYPERAYGIRYER